MRKRLILAKEILADDGSIYVHLDSKMGHYIKVLLDEIFPEFEFSEIVWVCGLMGSGSFFPKAHETLYCYRSKRAAFFPQNRLGLSKRITGALTKDEEGWYYTRGRESSGGMNYLKTYISRNPNHSKQEAIDFAKASRKQPAWSVWIGKEELLLPSTIILWEPMPILLKIAQVIRHKNQNFYSNELFFPVRHLEILYSIFWWFRYNSGSRREAR